MSKTHRRGRVPDPAEFAAAAAKITDAGAAVAQVRLPLNLVSWLQMLRSDDTDAVQPSDPTLSVSEKLMAAVGAYASGKAADQDSLLELRARNTRIMNCLAAYTDRFLLNEYIVNRVEHRFSGRKLPDGYSDADEAQKITDRLIALRDPSVRQSTVVEISSQFPVRMTKAHFFQLISDGIHMDEGQLVKDARSRLGLVRSAALLDSPEGMDDFPKLARILGQLDAEGAAGWTEETYRGQKELLDEGMKELNGQTDLTLMLQQVINDFCAACVRPADRRLEKLLREILEHAYEPEQLDGSIGGMDWLEGAEEEKRMAFEEASARFDEYSEAYQNEIAAAGLNQQYLDGQRMEILLSDSSFADLPEAFPKSGETADRAFLDAELGELVPEIDGELRNGTKIYNRALMARIVSVFPRRFENLSELKKWMESSLASCSDEAEKLGCIEIIEGLL